MKRICSGLFSTLCLALMGQGIAFSHPQKAAIITIEYNKRSQKAEVVHRFSQHDAEHLAHLINEDGKSIITSPDVQERFARHVISGFSLETQQGQAIHIETIGYEFEEGYIWIYQEFERPENLTGFVVHYNALQHVWPEQVNTVNFKLDEKVRTLSFAGDTVEQFVEFSSAQNANEDK